ncbi:MAG: hypothetical protein Q7T44_04380 [Parvibaculum sp.]|nr:hypothetical protein [Parvibaculum sp.]
MLTKIDRVQVAVADAKAAMQGWIDILDAEPDRVDTLSGLRAKRHTLRIGTGMIEFLEPDGAGTIADAVAARGNHLFAAGASTHDLAGLAARIQSKGVTPHAETGQLFMDEKDTGITGLRLVLSKAETRPRIGLIDFFYEATILSANRDGLMDHLNDMLGLDPKNYSEITSEIFGYTGTLTLFEKDKLDRLEVITPTREGTTMERYFSKFGQSLYMAFAETPHMVEIEKRSLAQGVGLTVDRPATRAAHLPADQIWLHPRTLGGLMLGLSRPSMAWFWSGHPERVEAVA